MARAIELIAAERDRQVSEEGYSPEGDRGRGAQLAYASTAYAVESAVVIEELQAGRAIGQDGLALVPQWWPWAPEHWKPTGDPVRDLTKAGALIAAAIDTLLADNDEVRS
ncbi:hypothetical protein [Microbacterium sp. NPDC058389]|uniref:hypothetical protein n=1 Tax=Microbacterium sp. NPDC058389 TaxID=3346475 RepID=UPI00364DB5F2